MTEATLHITFSMSGAMDLRKAVAQERRADRVIVLEDCLSFGPISPYDPLARVRWVETALGYDGWEELAGATEAFWADALAGEQHRVVWVSRRSTRDYSGFLEFVWRDASGTFDVVDLTDVVTARRLRNGDRAPPSLVGALGMLRAEEIVENKLWDLAVPLPGERRDAYRRLWHSLKEENAALRVLDEDLNLRSAPITHFDGRLLSCATREWQKATLIIGNVLGDFLDEPCRFQVGDLVLASRLRALVDASKLECKGDLNELRSSWVRLHS